LIQYPELDEDDEELDEDDEELLDELLDVSIPVKCSINVLITKLNT
jgi:hypothetical protein